MKKLSFLFISFILVFMFSCTTKKETIDDPHIVPKEDVLEENTDNDNNEGKEEDKITLNDDEIILALDKTYSLDIAKEGNPNYSFWYDENVIRIMDDVIIPNNIGKTDLHLYFNNQLIKTVKVIIYEKPLEFDFLALPKEMRIGDKIKIIFTTSDVKFDISSDIASFDASEKTLTGLKEGTVDITATYLYDETLTVTKSIVICDVVDATDYVVDSRVKANNGDEVVIDNIRYIFGENIFNITSEALKKSYEVKVIYTDEKEITLTKSGIWLNGDKEQRLDLKITIASGVNGIQIHNFCFTGDSKIILAGGNSSISIWDNKFIDTTVNNTSWVATNKYTSGIIELQSSDKYHESISIFQNVFENIGDCAINVNSTHQLYVTENTFNGFKKDAVRLNNGIILKDCTWEFKDNKFIDGEYSGIYFRTYGSDSSEVFHYVDIFDNYFSALGKSGEEFSGAIVFRNYQEGGACINIAYNTFNACSRFIFLRNNAIEAHQSNFYGYVMDNIFGTIPSKYYFNNLNSSDSVSTNPVQTKLIDNAYLDGNGKDYNPDSKLFIGAKVNTRKTKAEVEKVHHFYYKHVMVVDKEYPYSSSIDTPSTQEFEIKNGFISPLVAGTYNLTYGNDSFEVISIKKLELVVRFINIALGEVGYQEMDANGNTGTSGNYTKYGEWYGINPGAWCAMFVSWCANQAGVSTSIIPKYASVQIGMDWYKDKGLFRYKEGYLPKAGDIMFMKSNGASHTGIVLYCDGQTLYTVEGNTSDCCACRKYDINNAKITGYGTPEWPYYSPFGYNFSDGKAQDGSGHSTR